MSTLRIMTAGFALAFALSASASAQITLTSPVLSSGDMIPAEFTCKGADKSPPLEFYATPKEAKSLVLIMDDPDAPGGLFTHWLVWNIDPGTTQIGARSVPSGAIEGTSDFGKPGYGGPCPPSGTHRYYFRVFALDQKLDLPAGAKRSALDRALKNHILARGELMVRCRH